MADAYQTLDRTRGRDKRDEYTQFAPHPIEFIIRDEEFLKQEGLQSTLLISTPSGQSDSVPIDESLEELGLYHGQYVPEEAGLHKLTLVATDDQDRVVGRLEETLLVEADRKEFQMAQYTPRFLDALSQSSGGKRFALDDLGALARSIPLPLHQDSDDVVLHLWHLPIFYWIFILCLPVEWYLRRRRGLA
jgi:hypothetical protein